MTSILYNNNMLGNNNELSFEEVLNILYFLVILFEKRGREIYIVIRVEKKTVKHFTVN